MSLRYALVGLLASRPSSGYELSKRFAVSMAHVWPVGHSQIYPELSRLVADGLIEQTDEGPRGRKTYAATPAGRGSPAGLDGDRPDYGCRSDANLREFFLWALPPAEALAHLERDANVYRHRLGELEEIARTVDWDADAPTRASRLALEMGLRNYRMLIDWANWAAEEIAAGALHPGGPVPGERDQAASHSG